jgi:hypothetical protein
LTSKTRSASPARLGSARASRSSASPGSCSATTRGDRAEPEQTRVHGRALHVVEEVREVVELARVEPAPVEVVARLQAEEVGRERCQLLALGREREHARVQPVRDRHGLVGVAATQQALRGLGLRV